ncbi:MAG: 3-deoxy-7-phosphoheptulonate synthase [Nitrospinota bacterium]
MKKTQDLHVRKITPLVPPAQLKAEIPASEESNRTVVESRETIARILKKDDKRLLVISGPCSIHDVGSAMEYAEKLNALSGKYKDRMHIIMRVYFEKPRTTVGWKGLINDPHLNDTYDIPSGLKIARKLLIDITGMGMPAATEFLDPIIPQYIDDLVSWSAMGARTTESQTHREMASGLSMPVGFKNSTDGNLSIAINAFKSARNPHAFLGIDEQGRTGVVTTTGNPLGHVILRGGGGRPNYDRVSVKEAGQSLQKAGLDPVIMIDCSHDNSGKKHQNQEMALRGVMTQRAEGNDNIIGVMVESNLEEGGQKLSGDPSKLARGVSITDECVSFATTEKMLEEAYEKLGG